MKRESGSPGVLVFLRYRLERPVVFRALAESVQPGEDADLRCGDFFQRCVRNQFRTVIFGAQPVNFRQERFDVGFVFAKFAFFG